MVHDPNDPSEADAARLAARFYDRHFAEVREVADMIMATILATGLHSLADMTKAERDGYEIGVQTGMAATIHVLDRYDGVNPDVFFTD